VGGEGLLLGAIEIGFLDLPLADGSTAGLITWFAVNVVFLGLLFWAIRLNPRVESDVAIMLVTLNVVVFVVAYFMSAISIGIGFAFGLFALFGIMRYRTVAVSLRHMSYLFAAIALGVVNALGPKGLALFDIVMMNAMIVGSIRVATRWRPTRREATCTLEYDRIDLVAPDRRIELCADVANRTGLAVVSIDVRKVSLSTGLATLGVRFVNDETATLDLRVLDGFDQHDGYDVPVDDLTA